MDIVRVTCHSPSDTHYPSPINSLIHPCLSRPDRTHSCREIGCPGVHPCLPHFCIFLRITLWIFHVLRQWGKCRASANKLTGWTIAHPVATIAHPVNRNSMILPTQWKWTISGHMTINGTMQSFCHITMLDTAGAEPSVEQNLVGTASS